MTRRGGRVHEEGEFGALAGRDLRSFGSRFASCGLLPLGTDRLGGNRFFKKTVRRRNGDVEYGESLRHVRAARARVHCEGQPADYGELDLPLRQSLVADHDGHALDEEDADAHTHV